jgi:hypothetical protein
VSYCTGSAASQECLQLSGILEEYSSRVAYNYRLYLGLLKTLGISTLGDTLPTLKKRSLLLYKILLASRKGYLFASTIVLFLDTRSYLLE